MDCEIEVKSAIDEPFGWLHYDSWTWLADHSESHEYSELDLIYSYLKNEITRDNLPQNILELSDDQLREEYGKRFPIMLSEALLSIGQYIQTGEIKMTVDFD